MTEVQTTAAAAEPDLEAMLAERGELCAELSARQLEFAALVKDQAAELAELRAALADARKSLAEGHGELAQLSNLVLELEDAGSTGTTELARTASAAREREDGQAREITALMSQLASLAGDHATLRDRRRELERAWILTEHELAVRNADVAELRGALARERELASRLHATLAGVQATRAWKFGRFVFRQEEPVLPDRDPPLAESLDDQRRLLAGSDLFDSAWYLSNYPEVADTGMAPDEHYLRAGAFAGHNPGPSFDTLAYLRRYRDVRVSGMNPLVHYLKYGQAESRDAGPEVEEPVATPASSCS